VIKYILTAVFAVSFAATAFADGAATYADKCADCHGDKGQGKGKKLKDPIAGVAADANLKAIKDGKGKMKPVKGLEGKDAEEVAKFVEGLKK
jgi:mono/diheme cytochrome c family protein